MSPKKIAIYCNNCKIQVGILTEECLTSGLDVITFACPDCNRICFSQPKSVIGKMLKLPPGTKVDFNSNGNIWSHS